MPPPPNRILTPSTRSAWPRPQDVNVVRGAALKVVNKGYRRLVVHRPVVASDVVPRDAVLRPVAARHLPQRRPLRIGVRRRVHARHARHARHGHAHETSTSYEAPPSRSSTKDIVGSSSIVLSLPATSSHATPCSAHSLRAIYLNNAPSESESDAEYTLSVATPMRR